MDNNQNPDVNPLNQRIQIGDLCRMLKNVIKENEKPYDKIIKNENNKIVDEWYKVLLYQTKSTDGMIQLGKAFEQWNCFFTGKHIKSFIHCIEKGLIRQHSQAELDYWIEALKTMSVSELNKFGPNVINRAQKMIIEESFTRIQLERWETIYSKSDDPIEWSRISHNNPKLWARDFINSFFTPEENERVFEKIKAISDNIPTM